MTMLRTFTDTAPLITNQAGDRTVLREEISAVTSFVSYTCNHGNVLNLAEIVNNPYLVMVHNDDKIFRILWKYSTKPEL